MCVYVYVCIQIFFYIDRPIDRRKDRKKDSIEYRAYRVLYLFFPEDFLPFSCLLRAWRDLGSKQKPREGIPKPWCWWIEGLGVRGLGVRGLEFWGLGFRGFSWGLGVWGFRASGN